MHAGICYDTIGADDTIQFHPSPLRISGAVYCRMSLIKWWSEVGSGKKSNCSDIYEGLLLPIVEWMHIAWYYSQVPLFSYRGVGVYRGSLTTDITDRRSGNALGRIRENPALLRCITLANICKGKY